MQSVEQLLDQEKDGENWSNFFGYKRSVDESGKGFRLGIMTKGQLNLLKKHGDKGIALDGTHCTTKYNMKLITMLVLDDRQTGRPVAFFFCHEEAQQDLTAFFQGVVAKNDGKVIETRELITGDAPQFWNAWKQVMGGHGTARLQCTWHVLRAWKGHLQTLKDEALKQVVLKELHELTREPDKHQFNLKLAQLKSILLGVKQYELLSYLTTNYFHQDRLKLWAPYARTECQFNVNMAVESFHSLLKRSYLNRKECNRLDETLNALLRCAYDTVKASHVQECSSIASTRLKASHQRHRNAEKEYFVRDEFGQLKPKEKPKIVQIDEHTWNVESSLWSHGPCETSAKVEKREECRR